MVSALLLAEESGASLIEHFYGGGETGYLSLNFDDLGYWSFILCLTAVFAVLILANALIKLIKPLQKALVPSPVLGGFILLAILSIAKACNGGKPIFNTFVFEEITYHCLGLGFIAVALKTKEKINSKKANKAIFDSSLITVSTYLIQGVVGLLISLIFFFIMSSWPASGMLVPMGFGQGPGQAYNWGTNYSIMTDSAFGVFENGKDFGLTVAALGFVAASVGGVIFLNHERRKGNIKFNLSHGDTDSDQNLKVSDFTDPNEIPASKTIDKLSVQFGFILIAYAISFGIIYGISKACDASGVKFLINTVKPLFWGFNFIIGTAVASLMKVILKKLSKAGICRKQYTNNYLLDRISGLVFDVMVVAAIGSINLDAFAIPRFIAPLLVMCVLAAVVSYFYVKHVCKKLYAKDGYWEESFLCMFGMLTGTASTGVILLREIDPDFKTPACNNMVFQTLYSLVLGAPIMLLMTFVATNWLQLGLGIGIFAVLFVVMYLLIRREDIALAIKKKKGLVVATEGADGGDAEISAGGESGEGDAVADSSDESTEA